MCPIHVNIEQMETRWIAHVDGLFGCFASHTDRDQALAGVPQAVNDYLADCARNGILPPPVERSGPPRLDEIIAEWVHPESQEAVNAFFAADVPALQEEEVARAARLCEWTYTALLEAVSGLPGRDYYQKVEGNWSIDGILYHTARGEGWYLERMGFAPPGFREVDDERTLLALVHNHMLETLPQLAGLARVACVEGELWSARKLLRRALWHRRDHLDHIIQFKQRLGVSS